MIARSEVPKDANNDGTMDTVHDREVDRLPTSAQTEAECVTRMHSMGLYGRTNQWEGAIGLL